MDTTVEAEIVKDSYGDGFWLCLKNQDNEEKILEIDSLQEVQAIESACSFFIDAEVQRQMAEAIVDEN